MTELLIFDEYLFRLINIEWTNGFLDLVLPVIRNKYVWTPLYLFIIVFFLVNFKRKGLFYIISILIVFGLTNSLSSSVIKPTVKRIRPCNELRLKEDVRTLISCRTGYSFTSSHAANHFALAFYMILTLGKRFRKTRIPLFLWAAVISYAQIYVGVHYPGDILGGMLLGFLLGWLIALLYRQSNFSIAFNAS